MLLSDQTNHYDYVYPIRLFDGDYDIHDIQASSLCRNVTMLVKWFPFVAHSRWLGRILCAADTRALQTLFTSALCSREYHLRYSQFPFHQLFVLVNIIHNNPYIITMTIFTISFTSAPWSFEYHARYSQFSLNRTVVNIIHDIPNFFFHQLFVLVSTTSKLPIRFNCLTSH